MNGLTVRPVEGASDLKTFIRFPWRVYREKYPDPNWVPPLLVSEKGLLDREKSPFYEHGDAQLFLAERNGKPVGRIAGIVNDLHVSFQEEQVGFFGFFESFNDPTVAKALVDAAADWVRERGLEAMRGPMNYSTNETCGLLIEGFDEPPTVMMTHNPPWYADLLTGTGMVESKEMISYILMADANVERIIKIADRARERAGVRFRPIDMKHFAEDVALLKEVYNDAWEKNWGFVPMTELEFDHMAKDLKPVVDPDYVKLAFVGDDIAGFALSLPDINQVLIKMNGRLLPFGWLKLMTGLGKIDHARVMALGVKKKYQRLGLGALFYSDAFGVALRKGYRSGEASWILADNADMRKPLEQMGGRINKRYMIYDLPL